ncbi:MAG: L-threonylcarbamoyladenylate synthase [Odoribacter sp.]|nr:L-threonylcarbamoyladenylate synthase [Odoribacter sp.]
MEILEFHGDSVNSRHIGYAVEILERGGIVIYPTDSLYALGCDALNNRAIERLCAIKGINPDKQLLSIVCADMSMAAEFARIDNRAFKLMKANIPGAFTFILPGTTRLPKVFKDRRSVGVRIPANAVATGLAEALGHPLLTTSVEIEDETEVTQPGSVAMHYEGRADLMLDGGPGGVISSTVIDLTDSSDPVLVRQGAAILG